MAMPMLFKRAMQLGAMLALTNVSLGADLPRPVLKALREAGVPQSSVGAVVQEAGASRPRLAVNSQAPMNPASVMKLLTTYAALELLGPAYRWKTEVYLDGLLSAGVLEGNVVLKGTGDPKLNYESFWMLLRALRSRGLREIRGDVLLDRSHFFPVTDEPFDNDPYRPYNVRPDALLVNFKSLRFSFLPEYERGTVRVFAEPALPGLEIVNALKISNGSCPEGRAFRELIQANFQPRPPRASFTGMYPAACEERDLNVALHQPEDYLTGLIRSLWAEMGGSWQGKVVDGIVPPGARLAYVHESEPLSEIVRDINKYSNNVMARQLYLTLSAEMAGPPARSENALAPVRQWLEMKRIGAPELRLENGSGLSRVERISAASMAALLQAAWRSAVMPEFLSSLPVVAADGTMRKRMRGERIAGQAHIKTGLLVDARTMAGFVLDQAGRRHVVVMFVNHPNAPQTDAAHEALLNWVFAAAKDPDRATSRRRGALPRDP
jgi:D-alanyl-D-alanine carboxypeptidase/D-alanyl-D-alanine-endopeptidase (penicillin-binding protein 4)